MRKRKLVRKSTTSRSRLCPGTDTAICLAFKVLSRLSTTSCTLTIVGCFWMRLQMLHITFCSLVHTLHKEGH
ncbi:unnamed protein product [Arabidopsis halleri]